MLLGNKKDLVGVFLVMVSSARFSYASVNICQEHANVVTTVVDYTFNSQETP